MSVQADKRPILVAHEIAKSYSRGAETVRALAGVSFSLAAGEFVLLRGASGSPSGRAGLHCCPCYLGAEDPSPL